MLIPDIHTHVQKACRERDGFRDQETLRGPSDTVPYAGSDESCAGGQCTGEQSTGLPDSGDQAQGFLRRDDIITREAVCV